MLEVATARCQEGMADKDAARVDEAFRLAGEAVVSGLRYGSERVADRARQFRRDYQGPVTTRVRAFDEQLKSALV